MNKASGPLITGEQIKAARALLRVNQPQFAAMLHISLLLVKRMESQRGPVTAPAEVVSVIVAALEEAGVELIDAGSYAGIGGPGVRLRGEVVVGAEAPDELSEEATAEIVEVVA